MSFINSGAKHGDFVIVLNDSTHIEQKMFQYGANKLVLPFASIYYWRFPKLFSGCIALSGIAKYKKQIITGPTLVQECPTDIGQWIALIINDDHIEIRTDFLGMLPIFKNDKLVSNRLHLIALILQEQKLLQYDKIAISSFFMQNQSINYQIPIFNTPISGVEIIPAGSKILINKYISIYEKTTKFYIATPSEYHTLIRMAATEICENIEAISNSYHHSICGLTGGKDSRLIYAALLATNKVKDVAFLTSERDNDVEIATGLVTKFGGEYASYFPSQYLERSRESALTMRRSIFYGLYHHTHPSTLTTVIPQYSPEVIRLTGGGGELYRPNYFSEARSTLDTNHYSSKLLFELLNNKRTKSIHSDSQFTQMFHLYKNTFDKLPGNTIGQKLDQHYLNFRNRFHFGQTSALMPSSLIEFHPIISPSLLQAAYSLPIDEYTSGRVIFDVTRALNEELAYCQYGKPFSNLSKSQYHIPSKFDEQIPSITPNPQLAKKLKKYGRYIKKPSSEPLNLHEFMWERINQNISIIETSEFADLITPGVLNSINWMYNKHSKNLQRWFSLTDALIAYIDLK